MDTITNDLGTTAPHTRPGSYRAESKPEDNGEAAPHTFIRADIFVAGKGYRNARIASVFASSAARIVREWNARV